jgi:acyl-CoA thioesterase
MIELIQQIIREDPYLSNIKGIEISDSGEGMIEILIPFHESIQRTGGIMHGGAIMTLLDTAGGLSILTLGNLVNQVTVNLNTNFIRPVSSGPVRVRSEVIRSGKNIAFCNLELRDGSGKICATASGSWFVFR